MRVHRALRRLRRWPLAAPLMFAGIVGIAIWSLGAPRPVGDGAPDIEFSAERAFVHIAHVAREPHPMGSAANARVRSYIVTELERLGLQVEQQAVNVPDYYGAPGGTVTLVNVATRIGGYDSTGAVVLMGHYDSVPSTPGANDDGAAVAALLETGRALLAGSQLRNDVILLFTDGEEPAPRYGASAFVSDNPAMADVGFVVNLEAVGWTGPSLLLETGGAGSAIVANLAAATRYPAAYSFLSGTVELMGGADTDFAPFREAGVPGLSFAYLRGSVVYHMMNDSPSMVDLASVQHHGSHALSLLRHFGAVDLASVDLEGSPGDVIYFTVLRSILVRYPAVWSLPLAGIGLLLGAAALVLRSRRIEITPRSAISGAAVVVMATLVLGLAVGIGWRVLIAIRPTPGVGESYLYLAGIAALVAAGHFSLVRWAGHRRRSGRSRIDLVGGSVLVWLLAAIASSLWMVGASYLFAWPTIVCAAALGIASIRDQLGTSKARLVTVAIPSAFLLVPAVDTFYQLAQPRPGNPDSLLLELAGLPAILLLLAAGVLHAAWLGNGTGADSGVPEVDESTNKLIRLRGV